MREAVAKAYNVPSPVDDTELRESAEALVAGAAEHLAVDIEAARRARSGPWPLWREDDAERVAAIVAVSSEVPLSSYVKENGTDTETLWIWPSSVGYEDVDGQRSTAVGIETV